MSSPRNFSIQRKQMLIIMLTSSVALLLACAAFVAYDMFAFRQQLIQKESSVADVVGKTVTAAIDFNDQKTAEELLAALRAEPDIVAACIYDGSGNVFATYQRQGTTNTFPVLQAASHEFSGDQLHLFLDIKQGDGKVGTIFVASDLNELATRLKRYAGIVGLVLLASLLIALGLARRLQRVISNPILHLAQVARSVALEKNYSLRAKKQSADELGQLVDWFNEMLVQIQQRDAALQLARNSLEQRVEERTNELAHSFSLLNATLESTTDGILAMDLTGKITSMNAKFVALWHFPADLLERRKIPEMLAYSSQQAKDPEKFLQLVRLSQADPEVGTFNLVELNDGRILERYSLPQRIDNQCVGVVVNWRDITERKQAQDKAAREQARFKFIFEAVPVGIASHVIHSDGQVTRMFNDAHLRICGLTREQHEIPDIYAKIIHPDDHARQLVFTRQVSAGQITQYSLEKRYVRLDGEVVWVVFSFQRQKYADGSHEELTTLVDITAFKQTEAALAQERNLLRTLIDNSPDTIYIKDLAGQKRLANPAELKLMGCQTEAEALGKTDFDIFPHELAVLYQADDRMVIQSGRPLINREEKVVTSDGEIHWILSSKIPLRDADGNITGLVGMGRNISFLKEAEAKVQAVHRQLLEVSRQAGMAEVATNVLHNVGNVLNSVNVSATLVADNAKKSKVSYLVKVVALLNEHAADLGAFITADPKGRQLPGYLSQLAEQLAREQQSAITELELLQQNIEHIKNIVSMQLSYAKISGVTETLKVTDLVEDALRMNAGSLARHAVELVREYTETPPITVEKHKVLQILVNLIRNAKYACEESGRADKKITVRIANGDGHIKISVADNGVGIAPENLTHIFSHGFTTRKDGHGFGLHSGALAAKELGGALTAHSDGPGTGATFILELSRLSSQTDL